MAALYDPTSTTQYTSRMLGGGGAFTDDQIQQLQQAGVTMADLQNIGVLGPPAQAMTGGSQGYVPGGGAGTQNEAWGLTNEGQRQQQNATMLKMMLATSGGGAKKQTGPPAPTGQYGTDYPLYATDAQGLLTGKPVAYAGPQNQASLLGAAALNAAPVINQIPSSALDPRSGVAKVGGALVGANVPQVGVTWDQLAAQRPYLTPDKIAALQQSGLTAEQAAGGVGVKVPLAGPWTTQAGTFLKAPTPTQTQTTPLIAAQPATATAYTPTGTPFATPPPAPGIAAAPPLLAAHTMGLADAGKAIYAHFGGDPNSATHADITQFHSELQKAATGGPPIKMRSGGLVPGRGNQDSVPALLTPGEYVIPKDQVAQVFGGRTPVRMAGGGSVTDDDQNQPPEARRKTLSAQTSQAAPPAAPGGSNVHSSLTSGLATAAHAYGNSMANFPRNPIGSGTGVDIRNTRLDPDPDIPYLKAAGMMGGGGLSSPQAQSALGGVASGLNQAAQAIASSVQPWQVQQSAIPDPSQFQRPPQIQFQQPRIV